MLHLPSTAAFCGNASSLCLVGLLCLLSACQTAPKEDPAEPPPEGDAASLDVDFLLSMSYDEASLISQAQGQVPGVARVAADNVEIIKTGPYGTASVLRATGHVFMETEGSGDNATALSQEAYITEDEIILRGRPVLKRGRGLVEGLADHTVFFVFDNQIRAIGLHKVKNSPPMERRQEEAEAIMAKLKKTPAKPGQKTAPPPPHLPDVGPWKVGANPLLPPLDDTAVPDDVRNEMRSKAGGGRSAQKPQDDNLPMESLNLPSTGQP